MIKQTRRSCIWLLLILGMVMLAACNPAGGDEPDLPPTEDPAAEAPATEPPSTEPMPTEEPAEPPDEASEESVTGESSGQTPEADEGIMTEDDRTERQKLVTVDWGTDWNRHTIAYDELTVVLPQRDGIPALDDPTFVSLDEASVWLTDNEPVIAVEIEGEARAYPLQILTWHEIVNDEFGDVPIVVTFCPLCNSALVFDRRLEGRVFDFGTSGWLRNSDLVMYDRQTESMWQQFTGEGLVGEMAGKNLTFLASSIVSFADFSSAFPEGVILSRDTGHARPYGENPYVGYDTIGQDPFLFFGDSDDRLAAVERVVTVSFDDLDVAYPLSILAEAGVINDTQGEHELVVFHTGGTASALDGRQIAQSADVGATGVFDPNLNGEKLTFRKEGDKIMDDQTDSIWNILGQAIDGPLSGEQLLPIVHGDHFWFSWAAFKPDTVIYRSD